MLFARHDLRTLETILGGEMTALVIGRGGVKLSITLWISIFLLTLVPALTAAQAIQADDLNRLQQRLLSAGWRVTKRDTGDLVVRPPGPELTESTAREAAPLPVEVPAGLIPATDIGKLEEEFKQQGWRVERGFNGALLVYPGAPWGADDRRESDAVAAVSSDASPTDKVGDLQALLSASGWEVNRDGGGGLVVAQRRTAPVAESPALLVVSQGDLAGLEEALTARGWQLESSQDGSLRLTPGRAQSVEAADRPTVKEQLSAPIAAGEVQLPVDTWGEARTLAEFWVDQQSDNDLAVGKIRKVNWIYLVSIVERAPPHRLRNQLAIRDHDGIVVPIFR